MHLSLGIRASLKARQMNEPTGDSSGTDQASIGQISMKTSLLSDSSRVVPQARALRPFSAGLRVGPPNSTQEATRRFASARLKCPKPLDRRLIAAAQ